MNLARSLQRHVQLRTGFQADGLYDDSIIQLQSEVRDVRRIRSKLMELAEAVVGTEYNAILILIKPHISTPRLTSVWESLLRILRPEVSNRLSLVIYGSKETVELPKPLSWDLKRAAQELIEHGVKDPVPIRKRSTAFYDILRILMVHWFRQSGPLTSKTLGELAGFSYPTIAASLERLEPYLSIHSDRRVELRRFPEQPWREFLALSEGVRATRRYADRSGRPRAFETLMERLRSEGSADTAIGGVLGARHYLPSLDISGIPRLDLTINASQIQRVDDIMHRLDPALKLAERNEPGRVVVHVVRQPQSLFTSDSDGNRWADEVDCILDLYEARLDQQAHELQSALSAKAIQ